MIFDNSILKRRIDDRSAQGNKYIDYIMFSYGLPEFYYVKVTIHNDGGISIMYLKSYFSMTFKI